jgi:DNA-binding MarR family transcriptional regulator
MVHDKSLNQYKTLSEIYKNEGKSLIDIVKDLDITESRARDMLAFFIEKGLVILRKGENGRKKALKLTPKGIEILECLRKVVEVNS